MITFLHCSFLPPVHRHLLVPPHLCHPNIAFLSLRIILSVLYRRQRAPGGFVLQAEVCWLPSLQRSVLCVL